MCNITHDAIHGLQRRLSKSYARHELIHVAGYFFRSTPPHPFKLNFCAVPEGLYILRVDSRWDHKFHGAGSCGEGKYGHLHFLNENVGFIDLLRSIAIILFRAVRYSVVPHSGLSV